jgi:uncharacterized membrane protein
MEKKWEKRLSVLLGEQFGKTVGTLAGVILGILYLIFGFWKTLVFVVIVFIGFYIGGRLDKHDDWRDIIDRFVPDRYRDS